MSTAQEKAPTQQRQGFGVNHYEAIHMENITAVQSSAQQLVRVFDGMIGGVSVQACDGRELHAFLKNGKQFSDWIKQRIKQYGFEVNQDYRCFSPKSEKPQGGRPVAEYHLTLDMAKELSMVENNDQGRMARRYFIDMERKALSAPTLPAPEQPIEQLAFNGRNIMITRVAGQLWFAAGNLSTALNLRGSDRILRSLAPQHKQQLQRGVRNLWLIDLHGALRAANYCKPELAEQYRAWLQRVEAEEGPAAVPARAGVAGAMLPSASAVERFGLEQLLDTRMLFCLDEQGRAQVKPIPVGALIVTPERLADVLRDPFTVPVEYLPNLMQVIAGRMGAVLQNALSSR